MPGKSALAISSCASVQLLTAHHMLLCPPATQTSPTATLRSVTSLLPLTVSSKDSPASPVGTRAVHLPSSPAVAPTVRPRKVTLTCVPGSSHPQTAASVCRCSTMLSPITDGSSTCAHAEAPPHANRATVKARNNPESFTSSLPQPVPGRPVHG